MTEREPVPARGLPLGAAASFGVVVVVLGLVLMAALISTVGFAGAVLLGCVLASFAVVVLAVLRRRPISVDRP